MSSVHLEVCGGADVRTAWRNALAVDPDFPAPAVRNCLTINSDLAAALREDAATCAEFALAAVVVWLAQSTGAPAGEPLGDIAAMAQNRVAVDRVVAQEVAATRASVAVLAGLPVLGFAMAWLVGSDPAWLITSAPGRWCLFGGVAFEVLGALWLRRMVRIAVRC
jgi:tight adherence protein B